MNLDFKEHVMTKKPVPQNPNQQGLFENNAVSVENPVTSKETSIRKRASLLPSYHANRDFFVADLLDIALKSDRASLEVPIFSLATRPDKSIFQWSSKDGNRMLRVVPSVLGRATQMDKDVLIYIISQVMEAENRGREDFNNKTIQFTAYNYFVSTNKPSTGGKEYERLDLALKRLLGTTILTNIKTNGVEMKDDFHLIERVRTIRKSADDDTMIAIEVVLSDWLFNAIQAHEVLKLNNDYFKLRRPLERRLYEIARKHCGNQPQWKISFQLLHEKSGSASSLREFRRMVREIVEKNTGFPDYRITLDDEKDQVIFWTRDAQKLIKAIIKSESKKSP